MASTAFAFPLACGRGHTARGSVAPTGSGGWDIRVEIDDRVVFTRHCTEWHRVERLCAELQWNAETGRVESSTPTLQVCGDLGRSPCRPQ